MAVGYVAPDRVARVAIDPALTLFEVHRVGRGVPQYVRRVAPPVKVDAFLAHAGGRQYEGPEGTVEGVPDLRLTDWSSSFWRRPP